MTGIIDPLTGKEIRNHRLEQGGCPKSYWARGTGTLYVPAGFGGQGDGYEGARALAGVLGSHGIRPDIVYYPNGQVDLYCPGGRLELSLSEAVILVRLLDREKPDSHQG